MKKVSTLLLKIVLVVLVLFSLALCIFAFPAIIRDGIPEFKTVIIIAFIGAYLSMIPFLLVIYQAWRLLQNIDHHSAFSQTSVHALQIIKYATFIMTLCYLLGMPLIYTVAQLDDAPGLIVLGLVFCSFPFVVSVFAAVLEKLFQTAVNIKNENDLTV